MSSTGASSGNGEAPAEADAVELDSEGKQAGPNKQRWTPKEALRNMLAMKASGRAKWWQHFQPVLVAVDGGGEKCFLKCTAGGKRCGKLLRITNPAETARVHLTVKACKGFAMLEAQEGLLGFKRATEGTAGTSKQPRIDSHVVQHANLVEAGRRLALFFIKSNVAFHLVEHEDLVAAFECLGMSKAALPLGQLLCCS